MDEDAARSWLKTSFDVSRETHERLKLFADMLAAEAKSQNLISSTTLRSMLGRHIVDSAQILMHASTFGNWLDLGSGAGLPGMVLAILTQSPTTLVEARALRANWLKRVVIALDLKNVHVEHARVEQMPASPFAAITARAFAPLDRLLPLAYWFSTPATQWVLPKGRSAALELASVTDTWRGVFTLVPSITDPSSAIIVARDVRPRTTGSHR